MLFLRVVDSFSKNVPGPEVDRSGSSSLWI